MLTEITQTKKKKLFGGQDELDMTQGSIIGNLVTFALPLLVGNLFQQLYNMVDTYVIGQTGDSGAYAAVGSVGPVINILLGFFSGLASGAGVLISQYFGAKNREGVRRTVHAAMLMTFAMGVLFTILGLAMTPVMLRWMLHESADGSANTVLPHAREYLMIYFSGVMSIVVYNMGAGILRAVGDSRRPLMFLVVSAVTNTVLDCVFVFGFDMGVAGVAWATVIAQTLSAILTLVVLLRTDSCVRFTPSQMRFDREMLGKIVGIGIPAAIQLALTAFANVFVQSYIANINGVQEANLGGWTTYSKIDQFIFLPIQSLALAVTTFVGQNLGIGNVKRARRGTLLAYLMSTACSLAIIVPVMIFASPLSRLFNSDPAVVAVATRLLHIITPFYLFSSINQILAASMRGAGNSRTPMIVMLSSFVGVRQIYLYLMSNFGSNELIPIAISYPVGWFACACFMLACFFTFDYSRARLTGDAAEIDQR